MNKSIQNTRFKLQDSIKGKIFGFFLDILFPKKCVVCGKMDTLFCDKCRSQITYLKTQNCPFCLKITVRGRVCPSCRPRSSLTGVYVVAHYDEPLKTVIKKYKYEFVKALRDDLADVIWPSFSDFGEDIVLTCVPSNEKRLAWRGYNQADEIAVTLARSTGARYCPNLLKRIRYNIPQTQLTRKERFQNVAGSFKLGAKINLSGKKVVIFDDLVTSGATLDACAKELRKAGAKQVWGFVLARNK